MQLTNEGTPDCFVLPVSDGGGGRRIRGSEKVGNGAETFWMCSFVCSLAAIVRCPATIAVTTVQIRTHLKEQSHIFLDSDIKKN